MVGVYELEGFLGSLLYTSSVLFGSFLLLFDQYIAFYRSKRR